MKQLLKLRYTLLVASLAVPLVAETANAQFQIDQFTAPQNVEDTTEDDTEVSGTVDNDGSFLGGASSREFILNVEQKVGGSGVDNGVALVSGTGQLNFNGDSGVFGTGMIVYSGGDFASGVDITDEGSLDAFRLEVQSNNVPFNLIFDLTDTSSNNASFTTRVEPYFSLPDDPPVSQSIALSNFDGVDLTSVSQLKLTYDLLFSNGTDARINLIETFDDPDIPNPPDPDPDPDPDPTSVPEPGSMLGLLALSAWGATTVLRKRVK